MIRFSASVLLLSLCYAAAPGLQAQSKSDPAPTLMSKTTKPGWHRGEARMVVPAADASRGGAPANDECSGAIPIPLVSFADCGTSAVAGDNSGGSDSGPMDCDQSDAGFADVWYTFNSGSRTEVIIQVEMTGMSDLVMEVRQGCTGPVVECDITDMLTLEVAPNTDYQVRIASNMDFGDPGSFSLCVSYIPDDAPENDLCSDVVPEALAIGASLTFTGTTIGATDTDDYAPGSDLEGGDPSVWHAFTTTECSHLTIEYCGTIPTFDLVWIFLSTNCPADNNYILANSYEADCIDGNFILTYYDLPAGTYYLPVMSTMEDAFGAYSITVSAGACGTYCMAGASNTTFEKISNVQIGSFANASTSTAGYEDFLAQTVQIARTEATPVTITLSGGYSDDQVLVWIDLDQSGSFEPSELLFTAMGAGPYTGTLTVPADALLGETRMRIRMHDSEIGGNDSPCGNSAYGQVEDYTANIVLPTSISHLNGHVVSIYPNPTSGNMTVEAAGLVGTAQVELTDLAGRTVYSSAQTLTAGHTFTLELEGKLAPGIYMLGLTTVEGRASHRITVR